MAGRADAGEHVLVVWASRKQPVCIRDVLQVRESERSGKRKRGCHEEAHLRRARSSERHGFGIHCRVGETRGGGVEGTKGRRLNR
jgi:hypothetical protein